MQHLILGGDLLDLPVQRQRLQLVQAFSQVRLVLVLLPDVIVELGVHGLQNVHVIPEGVLEFPQLHGAECFV